MRHKGQMATTGVFRIFIVSFLLYSAWAILAPMTAEAVCNHNNPTVTIAPVSNGVCSTGSTTYTVTVTNMDTKTGQDTCTTETFALTSSVTPGTFTISFSPSSLNLGRGASGTSTMTVTSTSQPNGTSTITVTATVTTPVAGSGNGTTQVVVAQPTGITFVPTSGPIGTGVTISGTGFDAIQGTGDAKFNGTSSTETSWNNTTIVTTVPGGATTGTVSVTNQYGCTGTGGTFTVSAPNQRPSITSTAGTAGTEATLYTYNITATDPDGDPITLAKSAGDTCNGTLVDNGNGTGTYTFTPSETQGGTTCVVGVVPSDAGGAGTAQNTTVTIAENNQTPIVAGDTTASARVGQAITINVSATDPDLANTIPQAQVRVERNGGTCVGTATGLPTSYGNGSFTGTFGFTPAGGDFPSCTVIYRACDNNGTPACSANRTVTVTVDQNDAPTISGTATVTVAEGAVSGNLTVTGSDVDTWCAGAGTWGYVTVTRVGGTCTGTVSALPAASCSPSTGTYTYTALAEEPTASCTVILRATDGGGLTSSDLTLTVTITEVNTAPTVGGDIAKCGNVGDTLTVNVNGADTDLPTSSNQGQVRVEYVSDTCRNAQSGLPTAYGGGTITGSFTYLLHTQDSPSCDIVYRSCDLSGLCSANRTVTYTVGCGGNTNPTISGTTTITVAEGAVSGNLTVTGSDADSCSGAGTAGWVSVARVGGTCTGTVSAMPAAACNTSAGNYTYTALAEETATTCTIVLRATDGLGLLSTDLTATVTITEVNQTPTVAGDTALSGAVGSPITVNVSAADADRPTTLVQSNVRVERNGGTCTGAATGLPTSYGAGAFSGTFSYTPLAGDGASCTILYRACDQNGTPACSANRTLTVTIGSTNTAPTITGTVAITVAEGATSANLTVTGNDADTCSGPGTNGYVTISRVGGTCTGTVSALPAPSCKPSTGNYTYTALAEESAASCTIVLRATDGPGLTSSDMTVTVTITEVNQTPTISGDTTVGGTVGTPIAVSVTATDADLPGTIAQAQVRVARNGGTCVGTVSGLPTAFGNGLFDGTFNYTPAAGDGASCTILYRACDNNGTPACSANRTLTVSISVGNAPPTISGTTAISVNEGAVSANLTVTGSDTNTCSGPGSSGYVQVLKVGGTCTGTVSAMPAGACTTSTGNYTYTALAEETVTSCTIILRALDGGSMTSALHTVTVTINEVNQTPTVGGATTASGQTGYPLVINVSATDADRPNSVPQSYVRVARNGGTCTGVTAGLPTAWGGGAFNGTFNYVPAVGDGASCTIIYRACDNNGTPACSANRTLTVTVNQNDAPTISGTTTITVAEGAVTTPLTLTGSDVDPCLGAGSTGFVRLDRIGGTCSGTVSALPAPSCSPSSGTYTYTARTEEPTATCTIIFRATDGIGATSANLTLTVTITEVNQTPTVSGDTAVSGPIGSPITVSVSATDADLPASSAQGNVRVARNGGTCVGTVVGLPTALGQGAFNGTFNYTPAAGDGASCTILYRACDNNGTPACSANRTLTVTIACNHQPPTITVIAPDTKSVCKTACVTYQFNVKNNDAGTSCANETYNLTYPSTPPVGFSLSAPPGSVVVAPGATSANQNLTVCANASASGTWSNMQVLATAASGNDPVGANSTINTIVDTSLPNRVSNFVAIAGDAAVNLTWTNTTDYAEILIKRKTGSFPLSHTDAAATTVVNTVSPPVGPASYNNNTGLVNGTTYFYAIYVKDACGNWNDTTQEFVNAYKATPQSTAPDTVTLANAGAVAAANIEKGTTNKVVLKIRFTASAKSVTVTSLGVQETGTAVLADFAKVAFWTDDNNDGFITNETMLGVAAWDGTKFRLTNMFFTVVSGTPRTILVTVDVASTAVTNNQIVMLMDDNIAGTITVQAPDTVVAITAISCGAQTIIVPPVVGDGYLLRRDDAANEVAASGKVMCTACHDLKIHNATNAGSTYWTPAIWGSSFTCKTCHTAHNTTNIYLVKQSIAWTEASVKTINAPSVIFRKRGIGDAVNPPNPVAGTWSGQMADSNDGNFTGICEVCHTITQYHRNAAGEPVTTHQNSQICTSCHSHQGGFGGGGESSGGSNCKGCHGEIWNRINGTTTTTLSGATIATKHTIGAVANTNDSFNQANPNGTWGNPLGTSVTVANRSCTNMCHSDHPHDQMTTHQANIYKSSVDSTATHRGNATGDNNTDFDPSIATYYGLCISCHRNPVDATHPAIDGANYDASAHDFTTAGGNSYYYQQHDNSQTLRNCTKCHHDPDDALINDSATPFAAVHYSRYGSLLFGNIRINNTQPSTAFVCYGCHGALSTTKDLQSIFGSNTGAGKTGGRLRTHPITTDSTHDTMTEYNAVNLKAITRHVACADCHDPHESAAGSYTAGQTVKIPRSPAIKGIWGVSATLGAAGTPPATGAVTYTKVAAISYEYELCLKCHSSYGWNTAPNTPTPGPNAQVWPETDVGRDFHTSNYSFHPLFAVGKNAPPVANGTNTTTSPPTSNPAWWSGTNAAYRKKRPGGANNGTNCTTDVYCDLSNTFVDGWQWDSYVTCSDCHDNDTTTGVKGPHGSAYGWLLKGADPAVTVTINSGTVTTPNSTNLNTQNFCVNCHRRDVYGDTICGGTATAPHANAQYMSRKVHQDNSADFNCGGTKGTRHQIPCLNCHGGMSPGQIHGSNLGKGANPATCAGGANCNRGWRFMNGASWNGHESLGVGGTCFTLSGTNDVSTCTQHGGGKPYTNTNYSYL